MWGLHHNTHMKVFHRFVHMAAPPQGRVLDRLNYVKYFLLYASYKLNMTLILRTGAISYNS